MDVHLRELFANFQQQFGISPGGSTAPSSPSLSSSPCLLTSIDGVSTAFIKAIFRACSALYLSNPWQRLRPSHLFGVYVHGSKPFSCAQFVGFSSGDPTLLLYRSHPDALSSLAFTPRGFSLPKSIPPNGLLRLTFVPESRLPAAHKSMIKSLSVEIAGPKAFPFIDLLFPPSKINGSLPDGIPSSNTPTLEELRWLYACLKAMTQFHPSLLQLEAKGRSSQAIFEEHVQTVDVQWPAEDVKFWEITSVKITYPPREDQDAQRSPPPKDSERLRTNADLNGWTITRQCATCEKEVPADVSPRCSRCKAVIYCGHACQKQHWKEQHKGSCELYKAMMEREEELELKGFFFPCLMEQPCRWLELLGLHGKGMWRRMCGCYQEYPFGLLPPPDGGSGLAGAWGMEHGNHPSDTPLLGYVGGGESPSMVLLSGWAEYYNLRELPMSSPVAALLSFPLSLYHIVTSLSVATKNHLTKGREVVVHYLGPEGELDWVPAFSELGHLLGGSGSLHIIMVGPEVPNSLSGAAASLGRKLKVTFVQGMYQEEANSLPTPQAVVILNSGLETYESWLGALEVINAQGTPAFFTEYSELCCANAKQVLRAAGLHLSYPVTPNPFRSPVRKQIPSSNLPWFSNGFVFGVNT